MPLIPPRRDVSHSCWIQKLGAQRRGLRQRYTDFCNLVGVKRLKKHQHTNELLWSIISLLLCGLDLVTYFYPTIYGGSNGVWFKGLSWNILLALPQNIHSGESQRHVRRSLKEPYCEVHVERNWSLPTTSTILPGTKMNTLEAGPDKPSGTCSSSQHLDCNILKDLESIPLC